MNLLSKKDYEVLNLKQGILFMNSIIKKNNNDYTKNKLGPVPKLYPYSITLNQSKCNSSTRKS
jgi:hypothetical protein